MGLPNKGYKEYITIIENLSTSKPIIASTAGKTIEEYLIIIRGFLKSKADLIEVNISCPNVETEPIAYDFQQTEKLLTEIKKLKPEKPIGLKLPPYIKKSELKYMANLILKYNINFITCINSLPNCLIIDYEKECSIIKPKKGFGGLSGSYIKPLALGNVRQFYELLEDRVFIIGVGGINSGQDAFEFLLAGADAVQVGTCYEKEGADCFKRINEELAYILQKKNYKSILEAKGKLKQIV
jgi:dihydroorotate dehydrogenase (fumarate)